MTKSEIISLIEIGIHNALEDKDHKSDNTFHVFLDHYTNNLYTVLLNAGVIKIDFEQLQNNSMKSPQVESNRAFLGAFQGELDEIQKDLDRRNKVLDEIEQPSKLEVLKQLEVWIFLDRKPEIARKHLPDESRVRQQELDEVLNKIKELGLNS